MRSMHNFLPSSSLIFVTAAANLLLTLQLIDNCCSSDASSSPSDNARVTIKSGDQCGANVQLIEARRDMKSTSPDYLAEYVSNIGFGKDARELEFPWQVRLHIIGGQDGYYYTCGGAVIDRFWVITSAQCALYADNADQIIAIFGLESLTNQSHREFAIRAAEAYIHERYNPTTYEFDFALIKMSVAISFTHVKPICVPFSCLPDDSCQPGDIAIATGWGIRGGLMFDTSTMPTLRKDVVQLVSNVACHFIYPIDASAISRYKWCVGQQYTPLPTCAGDDGGPLICLKKVKQETGNSEYYFQLAGITSWPYHKGCSQFISKARSLYQGFGRVCSVSRWIRKIIEHF